MGASVHALAAHRAPSTLYGRYHDDMQARGRVGSSPTSEYIMMSDDPIEAEDLDRTNIQVHNGYKTVGARPALINHIILILAWLNIELFNP